MLELELYCMYGMVLYSYCIRTGHLNVTVFVSTRVILYVCVWCPCYNYYIIQLYSGAAVSILEVLGLGSSIIYYCIV